MALLCIGAGALVAMRGAGTLVDRWGAPALPAVLAAFAGAAVLPGLATSTATLCAALLVLGATSGAVDVAINAEGARTEAGSGRPVLSLAHGTFSACVVAGSLAAGALRAAGAGALLVLVLVAVVVAAVAVVLLRAPAAAAAPAPTQGSLRPIPRLLVILGALCALAFFVENAWQSWGAVHLETDLGASPAPGRAGSRPLRRRGRALAPRWPRRSPGACPSSRCCAAARRSARRGRCVGALATSAGPALAGIFLAGAGISICAPVLFSIAGRSVDEAVRGAAVSIVTTIAYLGFLVGPAAVGLLADATALRTSLAAVAAVAVVLAILAPAGARSSG